MAARLTGLNGLNRKNPFFALNRKIILSLATTMNVYNDITLDIIKNNLTKKTCLKLHKLSENNSVLSFAWCKVRAV